MAPSKKVTKSLCAFFDAGGELTRNEFSRSTTAGDQSANKALGADAPHIN
jgi:hypothetical protein